MNTHFRPVTVHQLPSRLDQGQAVAFLQILKDESPLERPRIVLDCSRLKQVDNAMIHLLLCCLEEGMKRNGDVRLAGLSLPAEAILGRNGLMQLFEAFDSPAAAIESYASPFGVSVFATHSRERAEGSAA